MYVRPEANRSPKCNLRYSQLQYRNTKNGLFNKTEDILCPAVTLEMNNIYISTDSGFFNEGEGVDVIL